MTNTIKNGSVATTNIAEGNGALSVECPEPEVYTMQKRAVRSTLYALAITLSLLGNCAVICVVRRNRRMRNITHHLIVNMAVADLLITAFHMPYQLQVQITHSAEMVVGGVVGEVICKLVGFSQDVSIACSVLSLMAIAIDRFIAVLLPLKRAMLLRQGKYAVVPIWIVSIIICAPLLYSSRIEVYQGRSYCYEDWSPLFDPDTAGRDFTLALFLLLYMFPLTVIVILYTCVGIKVWYRSIPGQAVIRRNQMHSRAKKKLLRMLIILVCLFTLCWLPYHVIYFMQFFNDKYRTCSPPETWIFYCIFIGQANSAINPCVYFVFHKEYRKGLYQILPCSYNDCGVNDRLSRPVRPSL